MNLTREILYRAAVVALRRDATWTFLEHVIADSSPVQVRENVKSMVRSLRVQFVLADVGHWQRVARVTL